MSNWAGQFPETLTIKPLTSPAAGVIHLPGSKSITNRALVLAALSGSGCTLTGVLHSEDTEVMVGALETLGFGIKADWENASIHLSQTPGNNIIPAREADLHLANSGTSMRFLTALVGLGHGRYRLDGVPRMRERPIEDLLAALRQLGVHAVSEQNNGCPPVLVETTGLEGGRVEIKGDISSQFPSALLMASTKAKDYVTISVQGLPVSWPYVMMTADMMHQFGSTVIPKPAEQSFIIPAPQHFERKSYAVEPDISAASYFFAAAAVTGGTVDFPQLGSANWPAANLRFGKHLQGDMRFLEVLAGMGCLIQKGQETLSVKGGPLQGIDVDMNDISDTVMTLAAVACFADGPTTIRNVAHIRHKETDRLNALATELRRIGAHVQEFADGLTINPRPLHGAEIETYNDHRMAMSMAMIGLRIPGIVIKNPGCVVKTYPNFFADLEKLRC
jgi:3-phosphoshikimate 1-carboxyvinyltransferase